MSEDSYYAHDNIYGQDSQSNPFHRFHKHHGMNVCLADGRTAACRTTSFAHALTFSERPLQPDELFLIQIQCTESGWSGALRIGLTQHRPDELSELPTYAMPDLSEGGRAWICAVNKTLKSSTADIPLSKFNLDILLPPSCEEYRGKSMPLSTDKGSRIGVYYEVHTGSDHRSFASMHVIANGVDSGSIHQQIPYGRDPLWVVVDVYGTTKEVKIIQQYHLPTLDQLCTKVVLKRCQLDDVESLPLPPQIIKKISQQDD